MFSHQLVCPTIGGYMLDDNPNDKSVYATIAELVMHSPECQGFTFAGLYLNKEPGRKGQMNSQKDPLYGVRVPARTRGGTLTPGPAPVNTKPAGKVPPPPPPGGPPPPGQPVMMMTPNGMTQQNYAYLPGLFNPPPPDAILNPPNSARGRGKVNGNQF